MKKIYLLSTGGTIEKVYSEQRGVVENRVSKLDRYLRMLRLPESDICSIPLMNKDSLEMTDADRAAIAAAVAASAARHVIVTHGTDTMVATAQALGTQSGRTVVLTGALQPGRFSDSDAPFNLGMAFAAVQSLPDGVYIVANGQVFRPDRVRKNLELNRFEPL